MQPKAKKAQSGRKTYRREASNSQAQLVREGHWLAPVSIVIVTVTAFFPVLGNEFVNWDDVANFLENPNYRGLGWPQLRWMFTNFHMGHYQPLSWLTLGVDYIFWGIDPFGYHLTSLALHSGAAVAFFFFVKELLYFGTGSREERPSIWIGAAVAALLFAVHPLRVESVAWATERRDVLSGFFYTATLLAYVHGWRTEKLSGKWYWLALALFLCALLSKSITVTLPVVLLILDFYPLRRIGARQGWFNETARAVYWEKVPFVALSAGASVVAFIALTGVKNMASLETLSGLNRLTISAYSLWFYFWKTLAPFQLSPLYEMPKAANLSTGLFLLTDVLVIAALTFVIVLRGRVPGLAAVGTAYVVTLLPVLGIFQNGPQIVADRYSYLACMGWAVLVGAAYQHLWDADRIQYRNLASGVAGVVLIGLMFLTWRQTQVWHDSEALWRRAVAVADGSIFQSGFSHNHFGILLADRGDMEAAVEQFSQAVQINPKSAEFHNQLAVALENRGKLEEATRHYEEAIRLQPIATFYNNLGSALLRQGRLDDAVRSFRQALTLNPNESAIHFNLGNLLVRQGRLDEGANELLEATRLKPDFAEAYHNLGRVVAARGQLDRAIDYFRDALRIKPEFAEAQVSLGRALAEQRDQNEAAKHNEQAQRILNSHMRVN